MRMLVLVAATTACSSPRDREPPPRASSTQPTADARVIVPDAGLPAWMDEAVARGGPGLCAVIREGGVVVSRRDASGRLLESFELDDRHRRDPVARTEFHYDRGGRLTQVTTRGSDHHDFDSTTDLFYDAHGWIIRVRKHPEGGDYKGQDKNITYKWQGEAVAAPASDATRDGFEDPTDPIQRAIPFHGTVHEAQYYDGSPAPQPEHEYTHTFDARGRRVETTSVGWAGPATHPRYEWDAGDQLLAIRDDASSWPVTRYDWRDHLPVALHNLDRDGKEVRREAYRHDARGRLVEVLVFVAPDPNGRLASSTYDPSSKTLATTYVLDDDATVPRVRRLFRYDCGPP